MENKSYVVLYDPKEYERTIHKCNLPDLASRSNTIWWQTIIECEECAQKWVARCFRDDHYSNRWDKLRWYHFKWKRNLRR